MTPEGYTNAHKKSLNLWDSYKRGEISGEELQRECEILKLGPVIEAARKHLNAKVIKIGV